MLIWRRVAFWKGGFGAELDFESRELVGGVSDLWSKSVCEYERLRERSKRDFFTA